MAGVIQIQTDFTHGELSPLMRARVDLKIYQKTGQKLKDVLVLPQGAVTRRFGIDFVLELTAASEEYQLFEFDRSSEPPDLFVFLPLEIKIFELNGVEHPDSPLVTPFTGAQLQNLEVKNAQTHDAAIFVQQDSKIQLVKYDVNAVTKFTAENFVFKNPPVHDFQDIDYSAVTFTLASVTVGAVTTLTASSAIFDTEFEPEAGVSKTGGLFTYLGTAVDDPVGTARIDSIVGAAPATVANVTIITPFNSAISTGVKGANVVLEKVAISTTRGFPRSVTFDENRLVFGGSKSLPQTLFKSQIADYTDYSPGTGEPDDAIIETISSSEPVPIEHLIADRTLQVFTRRGEFAPPQLTDQSITPGNSTIRKQSPNGSDPKTKPVVLDNVTFYVVRGGKIVKAFQYTNDNAAYESLDVSTISEQVIANPIDSAVLQGSSLSGANFLFLVNSGEVEELDETIPSGSLAVFQTLSEQNVSAWTISTTNGDKFKRVKNVGSDIFFIIERTINGSPKEYLEKLNFSSLTDSTVSFTFGSPQTTIGGLNHLIGRTVDIIGDGDVLTPQVVDGAGQVTLAAGETGSVFSIGLPIRPIIEIMPVNVTGEQGPTIYLPKRLPRLFIDVFKSQGVLVNDVLIPNLLFDEDHISGPLPLVTGLFEINNLGGWERRQTIKITQDQPFPMTIVGIGYEVEL